MHFAAPSLPKHASCQLWLWSCAARIKCRQKEENSRAVKVRKGQHFSANSSTHTSTYLHPRQDEGPSPIKLQLPLCWLGVISFKYQAHSAGLLERGTKGKHWANIGWQTSILEASQCVNAPPSPHPKIVTHEAYTTALQFILPMTEWVPLLSSVSAVWLHHASDPSLCAPEVTVIAAKETRWWPKAICTSRGHSDKKEEYEMNRKLDLRKNITKKQVGVNIEAFFPVIEIWVI